MVAKERQTNPNFKMNDQRLDALSDAQKADIIMVTEQSVEINYQTREETVRYTNEFLLVLNDEVNKLFLILDAPNQLSSKKLQNT